MKVTNKNAMLEKFIASQPVVAPIEIEAVVAEPVVSNIPEIYHQELPPHIPQGTEAVVVSSPELESPIVEPSYLAHDEPEMNEVSMLDDRSSEEVEKDENSDLYNINNFTI
jgi:hypothetical protein